MYVHVPANLPCLHGRVKQAHLTRIPHLTFDIVADSFH